MAGEALLQATAAAREGRWEVALEQLVAAWKETPSSRVAALAELAATRVSAQPIEAAKRSDLEPAWIALASKLEPSSLPSLLATPWPVRPRQAKERLRVLFMFGPHPLIASALLATHAKNLYPSRSGEVVYRTIFRLLLKWRDPACSAVLAKIRAAAPNVDASPFAAQLGVEPIAEPTFDAASVAALDELDRLLGKTQRQRTERSKESLIAAIYEAPHDDGARLVLADFLSEHGDARGEFIALQIRRARGAARTKDRAREKQLLRSAGRAWFDGLDEFAGALVMERGFVSSALIVPGVPLTSPAWNTVESLLLAPTPEARVFVGGEQLRALRGLYGLRPIDLPRVSLPHLELLALSGTEGLERSTTLRPRTIGFCALYQWVGDWRAKVGDALSRSMNRPVLERMQTLVLAAPLTELGFAHRLLQQTPQLERVVLTGNFHHYGHERAQWAAELTRAGDLRCTWVAGAKYGSPNATVQAIAGSLEKLPRNAITAFTAIAEAKIDPDVHKLVLDQLEHVTQSWTSLERSALFTPASKAS